MPAKRGRPPKKKADTENPDLLTSQQEVVDFLDMSRGKFQRLLIKYPFKASGVPGKVNGRWHVERKYVLQWWKHVQAQELRHPDSRRMRPEEPPDIANISAR